MNQFRLKIKDYIQPFERVLAIKELSTLAGSDPHEEGGLFSISTPTNAKGLIERLAYWETIETKSVSTFSLQSQRESTINIVRNGIDLDTLRKSLPFTDNLPLPNRRCLRYGTHGIHEYRGKFFPQLVRSLINISDTRKGGLVADPMSGSGTTLVEAGLMGCKGIGLDMNPLSVFIGNTKCDLLKADPELLKKAYLKIREAVLRFNNSNKNRLKYFNTLSPKDQEYLRNWFSSDVLDSLDEIVQTFNTIKYKPARDLAWTSLSNILRSVSWQKNEDLRVRKEIRLDVEIDPKKEFLEEFARSIRAILAFIYQNGTVKNMDCVISGGDARECHKLWGEHVGKVDVVITSPPYATALPYLDTDRLSLCYLGLLPRSDHRNRDYLMIGNREINDSLRTDYLSKLDTNASVLPDSIKDLIKKIEKKNAGTGVGFRRQNLPALLTKYFFDMRDVLSSTQKVLKKGGIAYFVVGNNHTIAGGERVDILTADLLSDLAAMTKFKVLEPISMEMLVSRDIFKKNASDTEKILAFQKK